MEILLKQGDRIQIPEGCKAAINGNEVVIEKEKVEFKDGDILTSKSGFLRCPFIFKGYDDKGFYKFYAGMACGNTFTICREDGARWGNSDLSYATDEEKQLLFDKMKEQGLRWNAEEKKVEEIRWRAKEGEGYYHLDALFTVQHRIYKDYFSDREMVKKYNHFRTQEQAEKAAEVVKEALRKFHEENK